MAELQPYNRFEIERYLRQKMTPQEMHDFEKALMDDPFLADALEGYSTATEPVATAHLSAIEKLVAGEKQDAKVVALPEQKKAWWRVAAIILVVASASAVIYAVLNQQPENTTVATKTIAEKVKDRAFKADTIAAANQVVQVQLPALPKQTNNNAPLVYTQKKLEARNATQPADSEAKTIATINDNSNALQLVEAGRTAQPVARQMPAAKMMAPDTATYKIQGNIVNGQGEAMPYASVYAADGHLDTVADAKGNFVLNSRDSLLNISVQSVGYEPVSANIKNKATNKIVLDKSMSLSEVVVTHLVANKSRKAMSQYDTTTAEPVGGWTAFDHYLNSTIDSLKTGDNETTLNDDVVLEFLIDEKGYPKNIKTLYQPDKPTGAKAVEILTKGPRWKNKNKDKKVKLVIPF